MAKSLLNERPAQRAYDELPLTFYENCVFSKFTQIRIPRRLNGTCETWHYTNSYTYINNKSRQPIRFGGDRRCQLTSQTLALNKRTELPCGILHNATYQQQISGHLSLPLQMARRKDGAGVRAIAACGPWLALECGNSRGVVEQVRLRRMNGNKIEICCFSKLHKYR